MNLKTILLTGGGTAGHVTPHLALIPRLKELGYDIHYIGSRGIERELLKGQPLHFHGIQTGKLRRYFDLKNLTDPFRVLAGAAQSLALIARIRPDICFSKGGFVAVPVVLACRALGVPVVAHESDLTPGLANRISARFCKKVAATFPECAAALGEKGVLTGTPMRPELFRGSRGSGLALAGFSGDKPVLLMMGGSQGAQSLNAALRGALPRLLPTMDVLHLCGRGNLDPALEGRPGYYQAEFLSDRLPDALACADLVLSRSGANALCEFAALKMPMLLIPLPRSASRGDQILNAQSYERRGLARVLLQEDMTEDSLVSALFALRDDAPRLRAALAQQETLDGTEAVLQLIEKHRKQ